MLPENVGGQLFEPQPQQQERCVQVHSNESIGSVRLKVAQKVKMSPDSVQLVANDKMVGMS